MGQTVVVVEEERESSKDTEVQALVVTDVGGETWKLREAMVVDVTHRRRKNKAPKGTNYGSAQPALRTKASSGVVVLQLRRRW